MHRAIPAVCVFLGFATAVQLPSPDGRVKSFTAVRSEAIYPADSAIPAFTTTHTIAVRADGSRAELLHMVDPSGLAKTVYRKTITDVTENRYVVVDDVGQSLITYASSAEVSKSRAVQPRHVCEGSLSGNLLGFKVFMSERTETLDERGIVNIKNWKAPDLDCFALRRELSFRFDGEETQRTVETVISLVQGPPDPSLFAIPAGYVERSPSEAIAEAARRNPGEKCLQCGNGARRLDEAYFAQRRRD